MSTVRTERKKEHRRIAIAAAASLLIHLLIFLTMVAYLLVVKPNLKRQAVAQVPEPEPMQLTIVPPPPPPKPPDSKEFIDSAQGQLSEKAPENAAFESDRNTAAASQLPATSSAPVPTLQGSEERGVTLQEQSLSLGPNRQPAPALPSSPASPPQPPVEKVVKEQPTEKPPEKKPPEKVTANERPNEKPLEPKPRPEDTELALLEPQRPKPQPPKPREEVRKPEEPRRPSTPSTPGFQPERRVTRLSGGITSSGKASVDSVATPLGRYKKALSDAIGSRWYYYVSDMIDLVNVGSVQLTFVVRADGKVEGVKVIRNSSNQSLAACSVRSIMEAEIPPIPRDIASALNGNKLEVDFSFTIVGR